MSFKGATRFWPPGWGGRQTGGILLPTVTCAKSALLRALPLGNTNFPFNTRPQLTNNGYIEIVQSWALKRTTEFILNLFILNSYSRDDLDKYKPTRLPLGLRGKSPAFHPETNRFRVPNWYQDLFSLALAAIMLLKAGKSYWGHQRPNFICQYSKDLIFLYPQKFYESTSINILTPPSPYGWTQWGGEEREREW